jgi:hypothetical protein
METDTIQEMKTKIYYFNEIQNIKKEAKNEEDFIKKLKKNFFKQTEDFFKEYKFDDEFILNTIKNFDINKEEVEYKINEEENKQRNFIIKKFREFLNKPYCSEASILAIIEFFGSNCNEYITYYSKKTDRNLLLVKQLINTFASDKGIRYEDSYEVIRDFITNMKPINEKDSDEEYCGEDISEIDFYDEDMHIKLAKN